MQCGLWVSCRWGEVLLTVPVGLEFGWWKVSDLGVEASVVVLMWVILSR